MQLLSIPCIHGSGLGVDSFSLVEREITQALKTIQTSKDTVPAATKKISGIHKVDNLPMGAIEEESMSFPTRNTALNIEKYRSRSSEQLMTTEHGFQKDISKTTLDEVESNIMDPSYGDLQNLFTEAICVRNEVTAFYNLQITFYYRELSAHRKRFSDFILK